MTNSPPTSKRALILAHEPYSVGGQIAVRLQERGYEIYTHVVTEDASEPNKAVPFPEFSSFDVVVAMGSAHSLTRPEEIDSWLSSEIELIREARQRGQPVLGICFGGQLIAQAFGGEIEVAPVTEIGFYEIEACNGLVNPAGPGPWLEWHHDRFTPPPGAKVLAKTSDALQLFTLGRMAATQFHPEVDVAHMKNWLQIATDEYLAQHGVIWSDLLGEVEEREATSTANCHALVDWFLDEIAVTEVSADD